MALHWRSIHFIKVILETYAKYGEGDYQMTHLHHMALILVQFCRRGYLVSPSLAKKERGGKRNGRVCTITISVTL
jgi:hypothetical protein